MASHYKIQSINFALIITIALSNVACTEKTEENNQPEIVINVTEDKIAQLQREAQNGDPDAQYNLGYRYENGLDVPKDEAKALDFYQKAADQGHSEAKNRLDARENNKENDRN